MAKLDNVRVGKAQTAPDKPAHQPGVREGNEPGSYDKETGHLPGGKSTAARSTGINPDRRNPIDPRMPNLSPA
ncbi:MAG TPA: hypothetical protein VFW96_04555 [Thermomicrobiales bacterium]|nr:hypothetical protein [Thermomicrobiales bacterium]